MRGLGEPVPALPELLADLLLRTDPDAAERVLAHDVGRVRNEVRAAARQAEERFVLPDGRQHCARQEQGRERADEHDRPGAAGAGGGGDEEDADDEGDHARLRVGEEERQPEEGDHGRARRDAQPRQPEPDEDDEDRDDEVAAVDAGVAQERGRAEEALVRVPDLEVAREDELAGCALPEANGREHHGDAGERPAQREREPRRDRRAGGDPHEEREGEVEEEEVDGAGVDVQRPERGDRRQADEPGHGEREERRYDGDFAVRSARTASARPAAARTP